jgi:hypothetical protein
MKLAVRILTVLSLLAACISCQKKEPNPVTTVDNPGYTTDQLARLDIAKDLIDAKIDSLAETITAPVTSPDAVVALLKTVPGVQIVNEGDTAGNTLFVQVDQNGPYYAVMWRNQPHASDTTTSWLDSAALADTSLALAKRADNQLPSGNNVYLFSSLNGAGFPNWVPKIKPIFSRVNGNYTVNYMDGTVKNLRTVSNASVLVFYGHGLGVGGGDKYLMSTLSPDVMTDAADVADAADGSIMSANMKMATIPWWLAARTKESGVYQQVLCITPKFIQKYWTFSDNSIAIFDCCWSGSFQAIGLKQVMSGLNVSVTVGWSGEGDPTIVERATCVLLDRMLGANCVTPVMKPPQRPFGREDIVPVLAKLGIDHSSGSTIVFDPPDAGSSCGLLIPSIKRLVINEQKKELFIVGIFGDDKTKGSVTIDNKPLSVKEWSEKQITCEIGPDDYGKVRVVYGDHKSNPVNLSLWDLKVTFTMEGPQSLHEKLEINCPFRADLHSFREKPDDEDVIREGFDIIPTRNAKVVYEASGKATNEKTGSTTTYSGGGTSGSPYDLSGGQINKGVFWARFDAGDTTKLTVYESITISTGMLQTLTGDGANYEFPLVGTLYTDMFDTKDVYKEMADSNAVVKMGAMRLKKDFELDGNFGIKAGSIGPFTVTSSGEAVTFMLKWDACPATPAPVPEWPH